MTYNLENVKHRDFIRYLLREKSYSVPKVYKVMTQSYRTDTPSVEIIAALDRELKGTGEYADTDIEVKPEEAQTIVISKKEKRKQKKAMRAAYKATLRKKQEAKSGEADSRGENGEGSEKVRNEAKNEGTSDARKQEDASGDVEDSVCEPTTSTGRRSKRSA